jgi:hypothetical protein
MWGDTLPRWRSSPFRRWRVSVTLQGVRLDAGNAGQLSPSKELVMTSSSVKTRTRFDGSQGPLKLGHHEGKAIDLGPVGVRFLAWAAETGGGFSLVEDPIRPRTLVAPLHRHTWEHEYSFVLEDRMGALLGDVVYAEDGELAFKLRHRRARSCADGSSACALRAGHGRRSEDYASASCAVKHGSRESSRS